MRTNWSRAISLAILMAVLGTTALTADWPQWRGLNRDGLSRETRLSKKWPENGPPLLWSVGGLGRGYSSVVVANGILYVQGLVAKRGILFAYDLNGKHLWQTDYGAEFTDTYAGTRSTPTVNDGKVYVYSGTGMLVCCAADSGKILWTLDTAKEFQAKLVLHGLCESPLVVGNKVIVCPGGPNASIIAVEKKTGKLAWKTDGISEVQGYNSATVISTRGKKTVVAMMANSVFGLDPANGKVRWSYLYNDPKMGNAWPCFTPLFGSNTLYLPSGEIGCAAEGFSIARDNASITRTWTQPLMGVHHGGVVIVDGYVYATPGQGESAASLLCFSMNDGALAYDAPDVGYASIISAAGMLYLYTADGVVRLVAANPKAYTPISAFTVTKGTGEHWAHPVLSDGRLYIRHGDSLMVYWVGAGDTK